MKKAYRKKALVILTAACLFAGCGAQASEKGEPVLSDEVLKSYEHKVTPEPEGKPENDQNGQGTNKDGSQISRPEIPEGYARTEDVVEVDASKLNLRAAPSLEAEVIAQAKRGDTFTRIAKGNDGWDLLMYGERYVYAYAQYLKKTELSQNASLGQYVADVKKN